MTVLAFRAGTLLLIAPAGESVACQFVLAQIMHIVRLKVEHGIHDRRVGIYQSFMQAIAFGLVIGADILGFPRRLTGAYCVAIRVECSSMPSMFIGGNSNGRRTNSRLM
ncbi:hypothetical protein [Salinisphaera sp. PC39]|uniref:hypothetical protein n=1 Tax=Salinisphaera sp. PC39 TaxID=1304156 RepID=UPI00333F8B64